MPRILALIPCRSGSKGIPGKNTRIFHGKPLAAWAVEIGLQTCDETFVSTDDLNIGLLLGQYGAKTLLRPAELATDEAPMLGVVQHAVAELKPDIVVLLQPTQPFRTASQVREAIRMLIETGADSVVSVVPVPLHYSPDYIVRIQHGRLLVHTASTRRQDAEQVYSRDGTVYVVRREIVEGGSFYGRDCRPYFVRGDSVNLDTEEDWDRAEVVACG